MRRFGSRGWVVLFATILVAACGADAPSVAPGETATPTPVEATPTPEPTPTPLPTPVPTLPPDLDGSIFGSGWTLAASSTNVGETPGTTLRSTIGPTYSVVAVCAGPGAGTLTVTLRASGGAIENVEGQAPGTDVETVTVECPSTEPTPTEFEFTAADYHGVTISPNVSAPDGTEYIVLVGTHG